MANKTKSGTTKAATLELTKTISVNGTEYNINAVKADKVANKLTLKATSLDGGYDTTWDYDGSSDVSLDIVPAAGGKFNGAVQVASLDTADAVGGLNNLNEDGSIKDEAVLNYADLTNIVLQNLSNNSITYNYDGTWPPKSSTNGVINGLSVITGTEDNVTSFSGNNYDAYQNYLEDPNNYTGIWLAAFLYICSNSPYYIYFGTCEHEEAWRIARSASTLATPRTIRTDLSSTATASFDGSKDITPGVTGILSVENGGTGATTTQAAANNLITNSVSLTPKNIKVKGNLFALKKGTNNTVAGAEYETYGIDLNNSDIIGVNSLWFSDYCDGRPEGIVFVRKTTEGKKDTDHCDRLAAQNGKLYFYANENLNMDEANSGQAYEVYHNGGPIIPPSKGGTGQTSLANVTVGKADTVKATYYSSANASSTAKYAKVTISPNTPSGGADGDIWIKY